MHFFITPLKDSTIYEFDKNLNAGMDACLEIDKRNAFQSNIFNSSTITTESLATRILVKFDLTEVKELISNGEVTASQVYLNLFASEGREIPLSYTIFAHPISQSWEMGTGFSGISPIVSNGVTWNTKDGISNWISTGSLGEGSTTGSESISGSGGTWFTSSIASQSFEFQTTDIQMDVTEIVRQWLNNEIPNEGFLIKRSNDDETNEKQQGSLSFFSNETHTVFRPRLEVVWDDSIYTVPTSSIVIDLTASFNTQVNVLTATTQSFITGALGSDYTNAGNAASGALTIPTISTGRQFEMTDATGSVYFYSASDAVDSGSIFNFSTGSSLSESIQNLVDEVNNISGSSVVTASLSGSDTLVLIAAFGGTDGNLVTFSGSSVVLAGGTDLFVSASTRIFTASQYSFTQSLGIFSSCSFATESTFFTSGSETFDSISVTTESNCFFTAALGNEFIGTRGNKATGSGLLSLISASDSFTLNSDVPDSFIFIAANAWSVPVDASPTFSFAAEPSTASIPFTSILNADEFILSSSIGIFTFSASQNPVLPDTGSSNIFGFKIGLTGDITITKVSASDLFVITGSDGSTFEYSATLPWSIPIDNTPSFSFGVSPSTGTLAIVHVNSADIFSVTNSNCTLPDIIAYSASSVPVPPDSASQNLYYFEIGATLDIGVANLAAKINSSEVAQFLFASNSGSVLILSSSENNITFTQICDSVTLNNASISQSVQNLVNEINNSGISFISASMIIDNGPILNLSSSAAAVVFQSGSTQISLSKSNVSSSLSYLVEEINNSGIGSIISASISDPVLILSGSYNGILFQSGSSSFILGGRDGSGVQNLVDKINNTTASNFVTASANENLIILTASRAGTSGNLIQFTGSSFVLDGGTDIFISVGSESIFSTFSFDPNSGIFTSESFTFTSESFTFTSESITSIVSSSFDQRQLDLDDDPVIAITNLKEEYRQASKARFEVFARERFPIREFITGSWAYTRSPRALPSSSFYSIRDAYTEDEIVPFSEFSKISFDKEQHFFNLFLVGFEPERFYRILLKVVHDDGIEDIFDKDYIFKVIR